MPSSLAVALERLPRSGPSPTSARHASSPRSSRRANAASRSSARLISVIRPSQPITNVDSSNAELGANGGACAGSCRRPAARGRGRADHDAIFDAGATPHRDEVVPHLRADGDQSVAGPRERRARSAGRHAVTTLRRSSHAARGRERCARRPRPSRAGEQRCDAARPSPPSRCGCAGLRPLSADQAHRARRRRPRPAAAEISRWSSRDEERLHAKLVGERTPSSPRPRRPVRRRVVVS